MRLYLSSVFVGDRPDELIRQVGAGGRVAVVANACDAYPDRADDAHRELEELGELGLRPVEVDLRDHDRRTLQEKLVGFDGVWVRGGNTFVLREAMARSGFDVLLPDLLRRDEIAYGGYCAGCYVLGPSLRGIELCDPPAEVRQVFGVDERYDGLGVLDFTVVPHVGTPGPEGELIDETLALYRRTRTPFVPLRDGQVLVVDGDPAEVSPARGRGADAGRT